MRRASKVILALVVAYVLYGVVMTVLHPRFIYPFGAEPFHDPAFTEVTVPVTGRADLGAAVHLSGDPKAPVILFFMGNVGILGPHKIALDPHVAAGRTVVAMEYRGGGGRPGVPSEAALKADGLALFDALPGIVGPQHGPIFVHGYSLGTGIALHVAAEREVAGVMLDAPYARICELMQRAAWLPACQMPFVQKWNSLRDAARVHAPVLIQHGLDDQTIPPQQGQRLAQALTRAGAKVRLEKLKGGNHENLATLPPWVSNIAAFIRSAPQR